MLYGLIKNKSKLIYTIFGFILFLSPVLVFCVIYFTDIFNDVPRNRNSSDPFIKARVSFIINEGFEYLSENDTLIGFHPNINKEMPEFPKCSGEPIINISNDGQEMTIFSKSCFPKNGIKYFCADTHNVRALTLTQSIIKEVDESYAKSGNTRCF